MKESYHIPKTEERFVTYKYSDFEITEPPIRARKRSLAQKVDKYLIRTSNIVNKIKTVKSREEWEPPDPVYKR